MLPKNMFNSPAFLLVQLRYQTNNRRTRMQCIHARSRERKFTILSARSEPRHRIPIVFFICGLGKVRKSANEVISEVHYCSSQYCAKYLFLFCVNKLLDIPFQTLDSVFSVCLPRLQKIIVSN